MNFDFMPLLHWRWGYPVFVGFLALVCLLLYRNFRRRDWL
jgi:magnesium transporter